MSTILFVGMSAPEGGAESKEKPPITIRAEDIGKSVVVLGRLGRPLREMMTVKGKWVEPSGPLSKPEGLRFQVTSVNGKQLTSPVEFRSLRAVDQRRKEILPSEGEEWVLRAYESLTDYGEPIEYWHEFNMPHDIASPPARDVTKLIGVRTLALPN